MSGFTGRLWRRGCQQLPTGHSARALTYLAQGPSVDRARCGRDKQRRDVSMKTRFRSCLGIDKSRLSFETQEFRRIIFLVTPSSLEETPFFIIGTACGAHGEEIVSC